ncbi:MAG: ATP-binding protein, partial [Calditrichota bacterium]
KNTLYNYVLERQQVVLTNNYDNFCDNVGLSKGDITASSWLGIPMKVRDKVLGAVVVWDDNTDHYLRLQDRHFLATVTDMVSFAMENVYLSDYIVEKSDSYSIVELALPTRKVRNSTKGVLKHLHHAVSKQENVIYNGIFLRPTETNRWQLLSEHFEKPILGKLGVKLLKTLPAFDHDSNSESDMLLWKKSDRSNPLQQSIAAPLAAYGIENALLFPFVVNHSYLGAWIIAFDGENVSISPDQQQLYQFILYIMTQLIEKQALLERKRKYEAYTRHLERMKSVGEVASSSAHHLNNVLSVIIGKGQLLQRKLGGTPYERDIALMLQAANDGANTIRRLQMRDVNGIAREVASDYSVLNLNNLIQEVVDIARPRIEAESRSRGLHYEIALSLGEIKPVKGNATELREILFNLINNAIDAMPRGGKVSLQTTLKNEKVMIFVSDTGIGIPEGIRDKIFQPFYTTKGKQGNGLGLSIAREVISKHSGKIYVDSIPQKGSIFMIELPFTNDVEMPVTNNDELMQPLNHRILLVEDEGVVRETVAEILQDEGCTVIAASNANEAVLKFQKIQCDAVFTDLSMPNVNGIELSRKLKKLNPNIPIFIITGWNQMDPAMIKANGSIDGIIQKPLNIDNVRQELLRVTPRNGAIQKNGFHV